MIKITVSADQLEELQAVKEAMRDRLRVIRIKQPEELKDGKRRLYIRAEK